MSLLEARNLTVSLQTKNGRANAVENLSFDVNQGEILGIAGESGSGKTMTALTLLGLLPHRARTTGSVKFNGEEILHMKPKELRTLRGKKIAMVFQDPMTSLHPMLTIQTQLTEHMRHHLGMNYSSAIEKAKELLAAVRIPDPAGALKAHPNQFSGGMRQRIAIAMALACEPELLVADEPTTALDVTVQAGILRLLHQLCQERDLAVIVITHDLGVLSAVTDRLLVMYAGREVESGRTPELLRTTRHPYTRGILDSLPNEDRPEASLKAISGFPPELGALPSGCAFHPRCSFALASCSVALPLVVELDGGHRFFCPVDPLAKP
jgi:oligopeptide transport system ATP-binding protein